MSDTLDLLDRFTEEQRAALEALAESPTEDPGNRPWVHPVYSDALAVHPTQRDEAAALAKRLGVPTEFDRAGRPVFASAGHFKEFARVHGYRHKGY